VNGILRVGRDLEGKSFQVRQIGALYFSASRLQKNFRSKFLLTHLVNVAPGTVLGACVKIAILGKNFLGKNILGKSGLVSR
jgi:hypothetical protein